MPRSFQRLTIENIASGALKDLFEYEWRRIVDDIADSTKQAKAARSMRINIVVKPTEDRGSGDVEVEVTSRLAKPKATRATVYLSEEHGEIVSYVNDPKQEELVLEKAEQEEEVHDR